METATLLEDLVNSLASLVPAVDARAARRFECVNGIEAISRI
jgi:hypothetical protein